MSEILFESSLGSALYPLVLSYFKRKRKLKVLHSQEPSLIVVRIGSRWDYLPSHGQRPVGTVKISLTPKNEGTNIKVEFDFTKFYLITPSILSGLVLYVLFYYISKGMLGGAFAWGGLGSIGIVFATYFIFKRVHEDKVNFTREFKRFLKGIHR